MALPTTPYNFTETEQKLLAEWLSKGIYKPEYNPNQDKVVSTEEMKKDSRQPWALICPPPNAYARPHMGNISGYAYMDVMARFQRMQGKMVLVLPGKDHAGLEGEGVFVREVLEKQGRRKFDMKREDFYAEMMDFFEANMAIALKDEKEIGLSADFDRDTFTLDPQIVETVLETFVEMYKKKMIYKGVRIVNWDPKARTAVADNQIEYEDRKTPFFYFKYPLINQDRRVWRLNFYKQEILDAILAGTKTTETRVLNPEEKDRFFGEIKKGDIVVCVNKNTGECFDYEVTDARIYKDLDKFINEEDFTKINSSGKPAPESVEKLIESYDTLASNYGQKMHENGVIAIDIKKFEGDPDPEAVRLKNKFMDPKTTVLIQQINALTMEFDETIPFITGSTVEVSSEEVLIIGYNKETLKDLNYKDRAQPIGILMRLDKKPQVVFAHKDLTPEQIDKEIEKVFMYAIHKIPGAHIIKFSDYPEDKFYTNGFILGTVRPETKFGDTALAVALKDKRYKEFVGKSVNVQTLNGVAKLNIVEDYAVEKEFGTGMVKVTPAHSAVDWEIAQRHPEQCLPAKQVIGYDLRLNHLTGAYNGLKIGEAREVIKEEMRKRGTLVHLDENYTNRIQIAERTKAPIEPLLSSQWYLKYDGIKEAATQMVADGTVTIHPDAMVAKFNHWMENLRDWAISRSLWWGYRMPVWYHGEVKEEILQDGNVGELIKLADISNQISDDTKILNSKSEEPNIAIRKATVSDTKEMWEIDIHGWYQNFIDEDRGITKEILVSEYGKDLNDSQKFEEFSKHLTDENEIFYIAELKDSVVGWVNLENLKTDDIHWLNIYVDQDYQKSGIGRALMQKVIEEYGNLEIHIATPEKANLTGFYEKFGFVEYPVTGRKEGGLYMLQMKRPVRESQPTAHSPQLEVWVPLEYDNPNHLRVQKESPDFEKGKLIMIPGKHGYAHRKLFPNLKQKFPNSTELRVEEIDSPTYLNYKKAFGTIDFTNNDVVLSHSLGGRAIIKYILDNNISINHLILLAPGARLEGRPDGRDQKYIELITSTEGYEKLKYQIKRISLIYSNDELVNEEQFKKFAEIINADDVTKEENKMHYAGADYEHNSEVVEDLLKAHGSKLTAQHWFQDENVLDTWFSSGQWPYATLMMHGLMDTFFPTNVLVSAHDILENWDSRMMMFSHFKTGKEPFKDLFLTGLVKGTDGQKMSKSRGNILSTDAVREQYGTDSLRMAYYYQNSAGASYAVTFDKLKNFKNFNNKLWNASKFVLMNSFEQQAMSNDATSQLTAHSSHLPECKAVLEHIADVKQKVTKNITDFEFGYATETLYEEFWHSFCDVHIEQVKKYFYTQKNKETGEVIFEPTAEQKMEAGRVMLYALKEYLKMLHPFIPFITQRIWDEIPKVEGDHKYLMYSRW